MKRLQPAASDRTAQSVLFAIFQHHVFMTNTTLTHLPSGSCAANAAWVACAVIDAIEGAVRGGGQRYEPIKRQDEPHQLVPCPSEGGHEVGRGSPAL